MKKKAYDNNKKLQIDMILSAVCKPISMIISYAYIPILMQYLGIEKYGVWITMLSILSWFSYFDVGIGNGMRNRLTESISKNDGQANKLVSSSYSFITVIMTGAFVLFAVVSNFINWNKVFGIDHIQENLKLIVIINSFFMSFNMISSMCKNILFSLQKAYLVGIIEIIIQLLNMVGVVCVSKLYAGNLLMMSMIYGISMSIVYCLFSIAIFRNHNDIKPEIKSIDFQTGKNVTDIGLKFFAIQICALVLFATDSIIISSLFGPAKVTAYNTVNKVYNLVIGIYAAMLSPIWSAINKAKAENRFHDIQSQIQKLLFLMIPFAIASMILAKGMHPIMRIWLGQELNISNLLVGLGCIYCILTLWCNTFSSIVNGLELIRTAVVTAVIQAVLNIPLSLFFSKGLGMGMEGVFCGTIFVMIIAAVILPSATHKFVKQKGIKHE